MVPHTQNRPARSLDDAAASPVLVSVGVLTFHRPEQIRETVAALRAQIDELGSDIDAEVLVVDNDPAGSGRDALDLSDEKLRVVVEPTPGIAAARNRALDEAQGRDLLLFLDDDGRPAPGWIAALVGKWRETGAAAVAGWVDTHYLGEVDPWIEAGGFFRRRQWADGQDLPAAACGNLLLDLHQVGERRFSLALGLSGGEDTLLTRSLIADGGRVVFCRDAVVVDQVATERINRRWVLTRSFSHGNTGGILDMHLSQGRLARPKLAANGVARLGAGVAKTALGTARRDLETQARGARLAARGLGMTVAATGLNYQEYARGEGWRAKFATAPDEVAPGAFVARTPSSPSRSGDCGTTATPVGAAARVKATLKQARGPVDAALGPVVGSITHLDTPRRELVLTFDDGPFPVVTDQLAQVLDEHDAKAVFFALVTRTRRSPGLVRDLAAQGHEIALHGLDHRRITTLGLREADRWIAHAKAELEDELGREVRWFRPPHGAQSPQHRLMMARHGLRPVLWSGTTWDWKDVSQDERVAKAMDCARPGAILLAHDGAADASDLATDLPVEGVDKADLLHRVLTGFAERDLKAVTLSDALVGARAVDRISFSR